VNEAARGGGEAHERFGEVKLSSVVPASILGLVPVGDIGGRYSQLGIDFVERRLGRRETELALEEDGLGRISVRVGKIQPLGGIDQLLSLLNEIREVVQHDSQWARPAVITVKDVRRGRMLSNLSCWLLGANESRQ